ncbi:MAG: hypothetical protein L6R35_003529 [Caloplaca aegaea]|nr:MAG: hypothetical protein L6R35_003529 [Caloplaca aegaea]
MPVIRALGCVWAYEAVPDVIVAVVVVNLIKMSVFLDAKHNVATHTVEVTRTVDVAVAGLMERKDEQNGVAFWTFKTSTIVTT